MEKIYIENKNAEVTLREDMLLDVKMTDGKCFCGLEAIRLFPVSKADKYLSLLDGDRNEVAIIRDAATLSMESQQALNEFLRQYYVIPIISRVDYISWKDGTLRVKAQTNYGECNFKVRSRPHNITRLRDGRVLIKDINDSRFQIVDTSCLDQKTIDLMLL